MAPQLKRALTAAGLVCAAIVVAYLPPPASTSPSGVMWIADRAPMARRHARALDTAERWAEMTLGIIRNRDTVLSTMRGTRNGQISIDTTDAAGLPETAHVRAAIESVWAALPRHDPAVRVGVAIARIPPAASQSALDFAATVWTLPPSATDGHTCLVLAALPARIPPAAWSLEYGRGSRLLGPCAFYAAFGAPGARIQQWLTHGGVRYALSANWHQVNYEVDQTATLGTTPFEWYTGSFDFVACRTGQVRRCARMVTDPAAALAFRLRVGAVTLPGAMESWISSRGLGRSTPGDRFLADLVVAFGPDRFARFWHSAAAPDSAFVQAFGTPLSGWTHQWVEASYPPLPAGMVVHPRAWFTSVLCVLVLAGVGAGIAQRRRL